MKKSDLLMTILLFMYFWHYAFTYETWHFIDNANLILHEAGHVIFIFFGQFIQAAGGSIFQIMVPLVFVLSFFRQHQPLSGGLCLLWLGQNFLNVSLYAGDASLRQLPLLGGSHSIHDWHYLLTELNILHLASSIASALSLIGILIMILGTILPFHYLVKQSSLSNMSSLQAKRPL